MIYEIVLTNVFIGNAHFIKIETDLSKRELLEYIDKAKKGCGTVDSFVLSKKLDKVGKE